MTSLMHLVVENYNELLESKKGKLKKNYLHPHNFHIYTLL